MNKNTKLFIHENAFKNVVCEKAATLSRGSWVNCLLNEVDESVIVKTGCNHGIGAVWGDVSVTITHGIKWQKILGTPIIRQCHDYDVIPIPGKTRVGFVSEKTSYCKIYKSWSCGFLVEVMIFVWNLTATSAVLLPRCLSSFREIRATAKCTPHSFKILLNHAERYLIEFWNNPKVFILRHIPGLCVSWCDVH